MSCNYCQNANTSPGDSVFTPNISFLPVLYALSNLPPYRWPHDPLPIPLSCFERQRTAFALPCVENHLPRSRHVREVLMVWIDRFNVERVLREAHKVLDIFKDSLHEAVVVGVVLESRPCDLLHLLSGLSCVVCLQVSGAITLGSIAYH